MTADSNEVDCEQRLYVQLLSYLKSWEYLGSRTYAAGTRRIGHIPHVAPEGYLHQIFPPLDADGVRQLKASLDVGLPHSFERFLHRHNGINIFGYLSIYGLRTSYKRDDIDVMMEQPFDIVSSNTDEFPIGVPEGYLIVGSFGDGCIPVSLNPEGEVFLVDVENNVLEKNSATNIFEFLLDETMNAAKLFDQKGRRLDRSDLLHGRTTRV